MLGIYGDIRMPFQSVQSLCGVHEIHTLPLGKKYGPSFEAKGSQDLELHLAQWHYAFMAFKLEGRKWHPKLRADGFFRILLGFIGIFWKVEYTPLPAHHMDLDDFGLF